VIFLIKYLVNTLQENQQMRIMTKFRESENKMLDRKIRENMKEMSNKIREIDDNIKSISLERLAYIKEEGSKYYVIIFL
jgi:hypothetical protein